jgi:hypothetical protein
LYIFQWQQKSELKKLQGEDLIQGEDQIQEDQRDQAKRRQQNDEEDSSDLKQVIASS